MYPLIGITCNYDEATKRYTIGEDYVQAVQAAGGMPMLVPYLNDGHVEHILARLDGVLLSGGGDIDPFFFGEEPWPENGYIDPLRDMFEIRLARLALQHGVPILGICRGMQVLNVAAGGSICQDINLNINRPLQHMQQAPRWYPTHNISITQGSRLQCILNQDNIRVNSFHHQIIDKLGQNMVISALAGDRVPEAIEGEGDKNFILGVQFHPENMYCKYTSILSIFIAFIEACRNYLSSKNYT
jgi:putative glutamine amidotransferase